MADYTLRKLIVHGKEVKLVNGKVLKTIHYNGNTYTKSSS